MDFDIEKWAGRHLKLEEGAAAAERLKINEVGTPGKLGETSAGSTKREITIIEAGWGSSGYYSREMLARDGPKVFPVGTHMYMNHPSLTEDMDQPERTVEKLAAVISSPPVMRGDALVATADIFEHWAPMINAVAQDIGVSIRAIGEADYGEVDGKSGPIITQLDEGISVDFVTKAGAKGKVGMLIESARETGKELDEVRNAADWFAARIHSRFTMVADDMFGEGYLTRDERIGLSKGIGEALDAFNAFIDSSLPQLKGRDPFDDPADTSVGVDEGRSGGKTTKEEAEMADDKALSELQESVRELKEKDEKRETELAEAKTRAERAEDALQAERARNIVNEAVTAEVEEGADALPELPDRALDRVKETVLRAKLPVDENGDLDKDKLVEKTHKEMRTEAQYLSGGSGSGKVTGMGASEAATNGGEGGATTEAQEKELQESLQRLGSSEKAAEIAVKGR